MAYWASDYRGFRIEVSRVGTKGEFAACLEKQDISGGTKRFSGKGAKTAAVEEARQMVDMILKNASEGALERNPT